MLKETLTITTFVSGLLNFTKKQAQPEYAAIYVNVK